MFMAGSKDEKMSVSMKVHRVLSFLGLGVFFRVVLLAVKPGTV